MSAKRKSSRQKLLVKDNSAFLLFALLLVAALFLLIAFGPFKADKLGLLGKKQQTQQSEAANMLPPDGGGTKLKPPCQFSIPNYSKIPPGYGDVNLDGYVTAVDALLVQRVVAKLPIDKAHYAGGVPEADLIYAYEAANVTDTDKYVSYKEDATSVDSLKILRFISYGERFSACFGQSGVISDLKYPPGRFIPY